MSTFTKRKIRISVCAISCFVFVSATIIMFCAINAFAAGESSEGRLNILRHEIDFGPVASDSIFVAKFPIKNIGGRRLLIRQKPDGCNCERDDYSRTILPGETMFIETKLDTHELDGKFQFEWNYATSDPELPSFTLRVSGDAQ